MQDHGAAGSTSAHPRAEGPYAHSLNGASLHAEHPEDACPPRSAARAAAPPDEYRRSRVERMRSGLASLAESSASHLWVTERVLIVLLAAGMLWIGWQAAGLALGQIRAEQIQAEEVVR